METKKIKSILESLLFVSGEPIKFSKLAKICGISKNEVVAGIQELNEEYRRLERGFSIIQKESTIQLTTNPQNAEFVGQLVKSEQNSDLSRSALEVLSIIAYRGPITRLQIEIIRGVNCSYVLRSLMIKGLIERKETTDIRGYLYEISFDFLKSLGVEKVQDLPDWKDLSKNEKISELLEESENREDRNGELAPEKPRDESLEQNTQ